MYGSAHFRPGREPALSRRRGSATASVRSLVEKNENVTGRLFRRRPDVPQARVKSSLEIASIRNVPYGHIGDFPCFRHELRYAIHHDHDGPSEIERTPPR